MAQSHGVLIASAPWTTLQAPRVPDEARPPLVLLKNFPYAADIAQPFTTDWVPIDSEFQNATIHVHCQTLSPAAPATGIAVKILSSFDTVESYQIGSSIIVLNVGAQSAAVSSNLGPMVRVEIANGEVVPVFATLSVWLQPKST